MKIYIAGPMRGYPNLNFLAFHAAAECLQSQGYEVFNPADGEDHNAPVKPLWEYMRKDIPALSKCDAIALLPGWRKSEGSENEVYVAQLLNLEIFELIDGKLATLPQESVLSEAERIIYGDRNESYGHPHDDFSRTVKIWSAILGIDIEPWKVALCMIGVKLSRTCVSPKKRDHWVDMAGYSGCGWDVIERMTSGI